MSSSSSIIMSASSSDSSAEEGMDDPYAYANLIPISYEEIQSTITDENLITQGTHFRVYQGHLFQSGELINIVVRRTHNMYFSTTELRFLQTLNHKNIVSIFKCCEVNNELIIINKHEANGSLKNHLTDPTLTWMQRLHICVGVAHALKYLHYDAYTKKYIIHGNIKASKILLDQNWEPKLHGFGTAVLELKHHVHPYDYDLVLSPHLDPRYEDTRCLSHKSDIFSFGVLLFEVLFGIEASIQDNDTWYFTKLARSHYEGGKLDVLVNPDLRKQMNEQSLDIFAETAFYCVNESRSQRPDMNQVLSKLEKALKCQHKHEHPTTTVAVQGASPSCHLEGKNLDHLRFPFSDIVLATNDFSQSCLIGQGGYGKVYRAELNLDKTKSLEVDGKKNTVAIKHITNRNDKQGEQGFLTEIEVLCKCRHPNIVSLHGFSCDEEEKMILIYEFASNGSLADYFVNNNKMKSFTWGERIKICIDIAKGLDYLHKSTHEKHCIIHRDIKSENILLDDKWVAKITDFGLSKFFPLTQQGSTLSTDHIAGTMVYMDPEYIRTGHLKTKTDIYSFGVVMFEIMCGKVAYDRTFGENEFPDYCRKHYNEGTIKDLVDPKLNEDDETIFMLVGGVDQDSLKIFTKVAYQCLTETQSQRPTLEVVIHELENALGFQESRKCKLLISLEAIRSGTEDFSDCNCIEEGESWKLYEGSITHTNEVTKIIAKRWLPLKYWEFRRELLSLLKYKHENIISVIGYCDEANENIIVYEHASNRCLDKHLKDHSLTWMKRLKICVDVVKTLEFIHKGGHELCDGRIHAYMDTSSILLDSDWNIKISNFQSSYKIDGAVSFGISGDICASTRIFVDLLCGGLPLVKKFDYLDFLVKHFDEKGNLNDMIFEGIKEHIAPKSLIQFQSVIIKCLRRRVPSTTSDVIRQLEEALKLQEDYEIWEPKLPIDYKEIIQMSKTPEIEMKKDLYDMFCKGILLQDDKVLFSLGSNGEKNVMISAMKFTYRNTGARSFLHIPGSRFKKVADVPPDISKLKIKIWIPQLLLSPGVKYGAFLVFKFHDSSRKRSSKPLYMNLKYKMGSDELEAHFAKWRDDNWLMIELWRFNSHSKDLDFVVLLESLSTCYFGRNGLYIEGIELRVIDNVKNEEVEQVQQIVKSNSKKHVMLLAMDVKFASSNAKPESGSQRVHKILSQHLFHMMCEIKSQMLSPDTKYLCYLVFKLSKKCVGLHCPVIVRDLAWKKNKEFEIIYFRSPSPWNLHKNISVPKPREDGLMEVKIWAFNSDHQRNDCIPLHLKLIPYEGNMSGLKVCGLEFRPN